MFQFLIGRLKTVENEVMETEINEFQFLIGRLKTEKRGRATLTGCRVSIPHRQAKNGNLMARLENVVRCFNSS